jgi:iron complex transport system ATP-binding protein
MDCISAIVFVGNAMVVGGGAGGRLHEARNKHSETINTRRRIRQYLNRITQISFRDVFGTARFSGLRRENLMRTSREVTSARMSVLLSASGLTFAYADQPVLRNVSLTLSSGEVVALLGPNGSGKSTLIKTLLGHLSSQGTIEWDGRPLREWRRKDLAKRVAYLPQTPTMEAEHRVIDVLRLGRAPYWQAFGIESSHDAEVVSRVAKMLQLDDLLDRRMDRLSGGQRQRVFIGRCLTQEPAAMLLDEPNTFLDLKHQIELTSLLRKLASEQKIAVLMASHDLNLAAALADRVLLLKEGVIVRDGSPSDALQPDVLSDVYGVRMQRIDRDGKPLVFPQI